MLSTRGELGYVITDVAGELTPELLDKLESLPETVRLRVLGLTGDQGSHAVVSLANGAAWSARRSRSGSQGRAAGVGGGLLSGPPADLGQLGRVGHPRLRPGGAGARKVTVTWRSPPSVTKYSDSR